MIDPLNTDASCALKAGGVRTTIAYNAANQPTTVADPLGHATTYAYDGADRVAGLTTTQGATTVGDFGYAYSRAGQVTQATEAIGSTARTVGYAYDGLARLIGSTVSFGGGGGTTTYAYGYDLAGNRTSASVNGTTTQTRSYDAADQVTSAGYSYDAAGNLLADGSQT